MIKFFFLTIFPEIIETYLNTSMLEKAKNKKIFEYEVINIRNFTKDKHKKIDDYIFGGGKGMLFKPEPLYESIMYCKSIEPNTKVVYMSAHGKPLNTNIIKELSHLESICIVCGRYEGIDARIVNNFIDYEISIGNFIVTGGELPALIFTDALIRYRGLLEENTIKEESFSIFGGILEHDQYTRPVDFLGYKVPQVLRSGNHKEIEKWKKKSSLRNTYLKRPDLLKNIKLSKEDIKFLSTIAREKFSLDSKSFEKQQI